MPRAKATSRKDAEKKAEYAFIFRGITIGVLGFALLYAGGYFFMGHYEADADGVSTTSAAALVKKVLPPPPPPEIDKDAYNAKLLYLAHIKTASTTTDTSTTTPKGMVLIQEATASTSLGAVKLYWPVSTVYPKVGALLPANRIVAYYGNFYSKGMGVLGEYPEEEMLSKLEGEVAKWKAADPATPVIPAIDYIAVTAQGSPGADGKYRLRMPDSQIDYALELAAKENGIVILDIQVGLSNVQTEIPLLEKYLKMPNVHLAIDPEFAMHNGAKPGTVIGSFDASDINWTANYLAQLVKENNLPPKVLIVHRFTEGMVTNYQNITPLPEVQIVMDMDGWGFPAKKVNTYDSVIYPEPVQFTGFKLFYKNDVKPPSTGMLTPSEVLDLTPSPSFIQYQ
jgi:hypothetical protein